MYRAVSGTASEAPSARCGDVFLASFEWPSSSPPKTLKSSDATETAKSSEKDGISIYDDSRKNETVITEEMSSTQMNSAEEISKRMKRPSSFMSSECASVLQKSKLENDCIQDTKRPCVLASNNLQDIIQCGTGDQNQKLIVTSASFPYHVEWVSSSWSNMCGWSCDEVLGLDCKFLQGDATDPKEIGRFMNQLMTSGGYASLDVLNYFKDDTLHRVVLNCIPIVDDCGPNNSKRVTHIGAVLVESKEEHHLSECSELMEAKALSEVGMPLDRREASRTCSNMNRLSPINALDWIVLTDGLPLAHMLRYMIRSRAPIALTDREHRIVHVNVGWVALTGYAAMDVEGLQLSSLIDEDLDPRGMERWQQSLKCLTSDDCSTSQGSVIVNLKRRLFQRPSFYRSGSRSSRSTSSDGTSITRNVSSNSSLILEGTTQFEGPAMFPAPYKSELTQVELTPVPIGTKHFAVLCISQRS